jgi:hypothetical protein
MERVKGFEPSTPPSEATQPQAVAQSIDADYTQIRAQISGAVSPELPRVVAAWPSLGQPLKAAILAIVES